MEVAGRGSGREAGVSPWPGDLLVRADPALRREKCGNLRGRGLRPWQPDASFPGRDAAGNGGDRVFEASCAWAQ